MHKIKFEELLDYLIIVRSQLNLNGIMICNILQHFKCYIFEAKLTNSMNSIHGNKFRLRYVVSNFIISFVGVNYKFKFEIASILRSDNIYLLIKLINDVPKTNI
jgi:hypothetical protein